MSEELVPRDSHLVTDSQGIIQSANQAAANMLNLSQQALIGQPLPALLALDEHVAFQSQLQKFEKGESDLECEMTLAPNGHASFSALLTISALRGASGRIAAMHWLIRDVSVGERLAAGDQLLQTLGEYILEGFSLSQSLSRLCDQLIQRFSYPLVWVAIREADGEISVCAQAGEACLNLDPPSYGLTDEERRCVESILDTHRTLHLQEEHDWADRVPRPVGGRRYPAQLVVPLYTRDRAFGVLAVYGEHRDAFDPFTIQWFEKLARHMTITLSLATVRKETEARIFHLAHHDPLTDLPNRTMFYDRLRQALAQARRHGRGVGVLFVDLDRFKPINDSLGHEMGDALLKVVADRLARCVRSTDTIARLSGDEFTMVLQDLARGQDAGHVAQKVLEAVGQPAIVGNQTIPITASVGIALYPFDATDPDVLIAQADRAMYRAKEKGGHCYQFVSEEMNAQAFERLILEKNLEGAWDREEFLLHYQPEVTLRSGRIVGVEALLRWQHPELGLVFSSQFLPLAEKADFFDAIQEWVLKTACLQSLAWSAQGLSAAPMSVNLSFMRSEPKQILTMVQRVLQETGVAPQALRLEIAQSGACLRQRAVGTLVKKLLDVGVESVLDDVVYEDTLASLLRRLPFQRLKLASSLVVAAPNNPDSKRAIERCLAIGQKLQVSVIAKGVESSHQARFLRTHGCQVMQGYFCSRPLPCEAMTTLLRGWRSSVF